jgi:hypothetical protein
MPELPETTRRRLTRMGLTEQEAEVLMAVDAGREVGFDGEPGKGAVAYFDRLAQGRDARTAVNWYVWCRLVVEVVLKNCRMTHELLGQLAARKETFSDNPVSVEQLGELVDMVQGGKVTGDDDFLSLITGRSFTRLCMPYRHIGENSITSHNRPPLNSVSLDTGAGIDTGCNTRRRRCPGEEMVLGSNRGAP